jgi:hypothetical protein
VGRAAGAQKCRPLGPVIGPENRPNHDHVTMVFNLFDMLHRIVKP